MNFRRLDLHVDTRPRDKQNEDTSSVYAERVKFGRVLVGRSADSSVDWFTTLVLTIDSWRITCFYTYGGRP